MGNIDFDRKKHWENIYDSKDLKDVSWYQPTPQTSLDYIVEANMPLTAKIIDVGGGDSFLVDHLLDLGYQNITVLDISKQAISRAKTRLGDRAKKVTWIVSDVAHFEPTEHYDVWHDRAAFHFLTDANEIAQYVKTIYNYLHPDGILVIGTFSEDGPKKCSGIEITQYSEESMTKLFGECFSKMTCTFVEHPTPFDTTQNFIFCSFRKL